MASQSMDDKHLSPPICLRGCRRRVLVAFFYCAALTLLSSRSYAEEPHRANQIDTAQAISFTALHQNILKVLIQLGVQQHIAIGIVLDANRTLCKQDKTVVEQKIPIGNLITNLLSGSNSKWSITGGVIVVKPADVPIPLKEILMMRFDRFTSIATTMQGMGIVLCGYIYGRLHPTAGYAGDILSSPNAERIPPFTLVDISAEQVLNHIVSHGHRGAWILGLPETSAYEHCGGLKIYSYADDMMALAAMSCSETTGISH
jgi:hypothetical protein